MPAVTNPSRIITGGCGMPHTYLYLICFVFAMCGCVFPRYSTTRREERKFPCKQCGHKAGAKSDLKRHVLSKVSAGEAAMCACDWPSDVSCVLLYMQHQGISQKEQRKQAKEKRDRK